MAIKTLRETTFEKLRLRLVKTDIGYTGLVLRDDSTLHKIEGDNEDDVWRRTHDAAAKSTPHYMGFDGAKARFVRIFPGGFGPVFDARERNYKLEAKKLLDNTAPLELALTKNGLGKGILRVFQKSNLLSIFEKTRLKEALESPQADAFIHGAAKFANGDTKLGLLEISRALKPHSVANWTAATYLPFLWRPDTQMFLKPEVTKAFASRVGHQFSEVYDSALDPAVYISLLDLVARTETELAELKPRDRIDIQSFIWVVGAYTPEDEIA